MTTAYADLRIARRGGAPFDEWMAAHRRTPSTLLLALVLLLALTASACGDDDGGGSDDNPFGSDDSGEIDGGDGDFDEDDFIVPEVSDSDDLASQLMARGFGLPPELLNAEQAACLSDRLEPLFPDGIPDDFSMGLEVSQVLDEAEEPCGLDQVFG